MLDRIALFFIVLGGINWGLLGIFNFNLVGWLFGGSDSVVSRIVYIIIAISAIWCISLFFKKDSVLEHDEEAGRA